MTNIEWIKTLSAKELANWFYDEWLNNLQYTWNSSKGGLVYWLNQNRENVINNDHDFTLMYYCSFSDCDNFDNFGFSPRCIECKKKQSEAKFKNA